MEEETEPREREEDEGREEGEEQQVEGLRHQVEGEGQRVGEGQQVEGEEVEENNNGDNDEEPKEEMNDATDAVIPDHIHQHFASSIHLLRANVGHDTARAYLKSLCADTSLDILLGASRRSKIPLEQERPSTPPQSEDIWMTLTSLNNDDATYNTDDLGSSSPPMNDIGASSSQAPSSLGEDELQLTSQSAELSNPRASLSGSDPETLSSLRLPPRTSPEHCVKHVHVRSARRQK